MIRPFKYNEGRYVVEVEWLPGRRVVVYNGDNRQFAIDRVNFWDDRRNTYFTDLHWDLSPLDKAMRKFDALSEWIATAGTDRPVTKGDYHESF